MEMKCLWHSNLYQFDTDPVFLTIAYTAFSYGLLCIICLTHKKYILPSPQVTSHCRWLIQTWASSLHLTLTFSPLVSDLYPCSPLSIHTYSHTLGLFITQRCSISKTLNSSISFCHPPILETPCFLNPLLPFYSSVPSCLLPCLISFTSMVQRLKQCLPVPESVCPLISLVCRVLPKKVI